MRKVGAHVNNLLCPLPSTSLAYGEGGCSAGGLRQNVFSLPAAIHSIRILEFSAAVVVCVCVCGWVGACCADQVHHAPAAGGNRVPAQPMDYPQRPQDVEPPLQQQGAVGGSWYTAEACLLDIDS